MSVQNKLRAATIFDEAADAADGNYARVLLSANAEALRRSAVSDVEAHCEYLAALVDLASERRKLHQLAADYIEHGPEEADNDN